MSTNASGHKLLRIERANMATPIERKPEWIKTKVVMGPNYRDLQGIIQREEVHTVCQEAGCPNIFECWEDRESTFLIGGDACTRRCDFCQIESARPKGYDITEPRRVAESVTKMGLRYATITGVCRDDLPDEGAWLYAETIRQVHAHNPGVGVEMLAPDFSGKPELVAQVLDAKPEVFAHNVETVPRIFRRIRPGFNYERSLDVLTQSNKAGFVTKSNLILGMGETRDEVSQALRDLREAGTHIITITQYLRPGPTLLPIDRWVTPAEFVELAKEAKELGYEGVMSGPMVRSSYRAGRLHRRAKSILEGREPEEEWIGRQEASAVQAAAARRGQAADRAQAPSSV
ncbi:lipoyl synthase [Propionibacterium sp. oral taxon 192 str. F0372]|uniref:lipoyl synthase n=1 Tax=Propionibacterium sp. oral taxon 192 TaxID=671222 RepID=UPI0003548ED3|nr:lipoyl synthase [Propionibacterium sp. oral taxon 192]EPH05542.1 lipoyl synthase [Propionibacterium sp. oral taxon 192 str. F0372]